MEAGTVPPGPHPSQYPGYVPGCSQVNLIRTRIHLNMHYSQNDIWELIVCPGSHLEQQHTGATLNHLHGRPRPGKTSISFQVFSNMRTVSAKPCAPRRPPGCSCTKPSLPLDAQPVRWVRRWWVWPWWEEGNLWGPWEWLWIFRTSYMDYSCVMALMEFFSCRLRVLF